MEDEDGSHKLVGAQHPTVSKINPFFTITILQSTKVSAAGDVAQQLPPSCGVSMTNTDTHSSRADCDVQARLSFMGCTTVHIIGRINLQNVILEHTV